MNKQIELLALRAGYDPQWSTKADKESFFDLEEFAELIVQECASFIENKFDFCGDEIYAAEELRKHFGVEE